MANKITSIQDLKKIAMAKHPVTEEEIFKEIDTLKDRSIYPKLLKQKKKGFKQLSPKTKRKILDELKKYKENMKQEDKEYEQDVKKVPYIQRTV